MKYKDVPWYLISPDSTFRKYWDIFMIFILIYLATVAPWRVAFLREEPSLFMFILEWVIDGLFMVDIVITFFSPFERYNGTLELRLKKIAYKYVSTGFVVDFVASFPF